MEPRADSVLRTHSRPFAYTQFSEVFATIRERDERRVGSIESGYQMVANPGLDSSSVFRDWLDESTSTRRKLFDQTIIGRLDLAESRRGDESPRERDHDSLAMLFQYGGD